MSAHTLDQTPCARGLYGAHVGWIYDVGPIEPRKCGSALAKRYKDWFTSPGRFCVRDTFNPVSNPSQGRITNHCRKSDIEAFSQRTDVIIDVHSAEYPGAGFSPTKALLREASSASVPPTLGGVDGELVNHPIRPRSVSVISQTCFLSIPYPPPDSYKPRAPASRHHRLGIRRSSPSDQLSLPPAPT